MKKIRTIVILAAVMAVLLIPMQGAMAAGNYVLYNGYRVYYGSNAEQYTQNRGITILYNWFYNVVEPLRRNRCDTQAGSDPDSGACSDSGSCSGSYPAPTPAPTPCSFS